MEGFHLGERRYGWFSYVVSRTFALLQSMGLHVWVVYVRALEPDYRIPPEHAARYEFRRLILEEALAQSRSIADGPFPSIGGDCESGLRP